MFNNYPAHRSKRGQELPQQCGHKKESEEKKNEEIRNHEKTGRESICR